MISYYFFVIRFPRSRLESLLWLSYTSCRKDARSLGLCVGSRSVSKQANFPFLFCGLKNRFWHKRSKTEMSLSKDLSIALSLILKSKTVFSHSIALNLVPGSHFRRRNISCQNKNILVRGALNASISGFLYLARSQHQNLRHCVLS